MADGFPGAHRWYLDSTYADRDRPPLSFRWLWLLALGVVLAGGAVLLLPALPSGPRGDDGRVTERVSRGEVLVDMTTGHGRRLAEAWPDLPAGAR